MSRTVRKHKPWSPRSIYKIGEVSFVKEGGHTVALVNGVQSGKLILKLAQGRQVKSEVSEPSSRGPKGYDTWTCMNPRGKNGKVLKRSTSHILRRRAQRELDATLSNLEE